MNLIRNAIQTPDGTILESTNRHDCKTYVDANGKFYMVDGGLDYLRRSTNGDEIDLSLYDDVPHEVIAATLKWGTYGKTGIEPLKYITIDSMETKHIEAVLKIETLNPIHRACMEEELKRR